MSAYQANRFGRTARPKAPNNQDRHYVTGSLGGTVSAVLVQLTGHGDGTSVTEGPNSVGIYGTENQRYLHLHCSGATSQITNVFAYTYASNCWAELKHVVPSDGTRVSVAISANEHIMVDILGIDKVAFLTSSASDAVRPYKNFIAFSTF